jgi:hypothetical protein
MTFGTSVDGSPVVDLIRSQIHPLGSLEEVNGMMP